MTLSGSTGISVGDLSTIDLTKLNKHFIVAFKSKIGFLCDHFLGLVRYREGVHNEYRAVAVGNIPLCPGINPICTVYNLFYRSSGTTL